jgi:tetratricopeptide (TPR) repeat protein
LLTGKAIVMAKYRKSGLSGIIILAAVVLVLHGCSGDKGKIPVTTSSKEALELFLQGRDMYERLHFRKAARLLEEAIAEDSGLALAYLRLASLQPTQKGFYQLFDKALSLIESVSEGERLMILGSQAEINAEPVKQREYYQQLVALYPRDERGLTLLGGHYFHQQEYAKAIEQFNRAIEVNSDFSPPYNMLGYSYRYIGDFVEAEKAFKKYIALVPDDPNPYDSYAELLMKMGKYGPSIESYYKALEINPNFEASHIGIACNLNFLGKYKDARDQLDELYDIALDDHVRRAALYAKAVSYADEGQLKEALKAIEDRYALAESTGDSAAMPTDLSLMGRIYLEMGKPDEALLNYKRALALIEESNLSNEIKENSRRIFLYYFSRINLMKGDFGSAKVSLEEFRTRAEGANIPRQIRMAHELAGIIALREGDYDKALEELHRANLQDAYNFFRMGLAYQGKGETEKAREMFKKAANFNTVNDLNYAFVRNKARDLLKTIT